MYIFFQTERIFTITCAPCPGFSASDATAAGPSRPGHCALHASSRLDIEEMADAARVGKAAGDSKEGTYLAPTAQELHGGCHK